MSTGSATDVGADVTAGPLMSRTEDDPAPSAAPETDAGARPGWLRAKSAAVPAKKKRRPAAPPLVTIAPAPQPAVVADDDAPGHLRLWRLLLLWWANFRLTRGLCISLAVHATLMLVLSFLVFRHANQRPPEFEGVFGEPGDETILDLPAGPRGDGELGGGEKTIEMPPLTDFAASADLMQAASERMLGALEGKGGGSGGEGAGAGGGGGGLGSMGQNIRVPAYAITRGSFSVWTDPKDPVPRRPYDIIIQVQLPKSVTQYRLRDLSGDVHGTDGYYKAIKFKTSDRKGVKDGAVQIAVPIPGAAQLIKDTIRIRSELLNEEQTITIEF